MDALLRAIDEAIEDLGPQGDVVIVVAGDLEGVLLDLFAEEAEGFEPYWRLEGLDSSADVGRYRGYTVLLGPTAGETRVYVVDLGTWGTMVRVKIGEEQDLLFDVEPISVEQAQELLAANPGHYPDQPDDKSKLRKLQTNVKVRVDTRVGFRNTDPARARRISPDQPLAGVDA